MVKDLLDLGFEFLCEFYGMPGALCSTDRVLERKELHFHLATSLNELIVFRLLLAHLRLHERLLELEKNGILILQILVLVFEFLYLYLKLF